jgi:diadenosine tetraphosphate (Ap4A) HIT family hydrolase
MCDFIQYAWLEHDGHRVFRLVSEDQYTYVIVPRESHVEHHLLVVLKTQDERHKRGLIECTKDDLAHLGATISYWCAILRQPPFGYDTVYAGCYSDEGHVHFHLIPLKHDRDKGYRGAAMTWLALKECKSDANPFCKMSDQEKRERLDEIKEIVSNLRTADSGQQGIGGDSQKLGPQPQC